MGTRGYFPGSEDNWNMKQSIHLHLVFMSRVHGVVHSPPSPHNMVLSTSWVYLQCKYILEIWSLCTLKKTAALSLILSWIFLPDPHVWSQCFYFSPRYFIQLLQPICIALSWKVPCNHYPQTFICYMLHYCNRACTASGHWPCNTMWFKIPYSRIIMVANTGAQCTPYERV
jgi:hypothetical protein